MGEIISINDHKDSKIDARKLRNNTRKLSCEVIQPKKSACEEYAIPEHDSEPIKSVDDIYRVSSYLLENKRYRDNMLFIVGINLGLRISDLRRLRFADLIDDNMTFKTSFLILEKKTSTTRKKKKNRYIAINDAVIEAVSIYLENTNNVSLSDYMFKSESNNGKTNNAPMTRQAAYNICQRINDECHLGIRFGTHTLRKTFGYHQMVMSGNDPRKLLLLQQMFGHSSPNQTLTYIGITSEEIDKAYKRMNLGSSSGSYLIDSVIIEASS